MQVFQIQNNYKSFDSNKIRYYSSRKMLSSINSLINYNTCRIYDLNKKKYIYIDMKKYQKTYDTNDNIIIKELEEWNDKLQLWNNLFNNEEEIY